MLELKEISKSFGEKVIYEKANLSLPNFGLFLLEGENGVGKSTLLNIIDYNDTDFTGKLIFNNQEINKKNASKYRKFNVFTLYQDTILFEDLTIRQNLVKISPKKISDDDIKNILEQVNLHNDLDQVVNSLSMGEKKRLMISFSFLFKPDILLCDEITNNLDEENTKDVLEAIKAISKNCLVVFVSHYIPEKLKEIFDDKIFIENHKLSLRKGEIKDNDSIQKQDKTQKRSMFYSVFYQNRFFLIFFSILSIVLSGLGLSYAGMTLPYTDPDTFITTKKIEYIQNNFPYVFFSLINNVKGDELENDADIYSFWTMSFSLNNKETGTTMFYMFKNQAQIELVDGVRPSNQHEFLAPSSKYDESAIGATFKIEEADYKIVGIYKSLDEKSNNISELSLKENVNILESHLFVDGLIGIYSKDFKLTTTLAQTVSYGIRSDKSDIISKYKFDSFSHAMFLNDGTNADEFLGKIYQDNITNKLLAVLFICFYFLFNLTSLVILFNLNKKKLIIYRLFGLDRKSIARTLIELLLISAIAPLVIFLSTSIISSYFFDANLVGQFLYSASLSLAPYNYLFAVFSILYILFILALALIYNRIALTGDLKESLALVRKTSNK